MFVQAMGGGNYKVYYEIYPSGTTSVAYSKVLDFDPKHVWFAMPTTNANNKEVIFHYDVKKNTLRSKAYTTPSTESNQDSHIGVSGYVYYNSTTKTLTINSPWSVTNNYANIVVTG